MYFYNQATPPEEYAAAFRRDREYQRINKWPKDVCGREIRPKYTKEEKRKQGVIIAFVYLVVLPLIFVAPILLFLQMIGML